ncbi:MAG: VIT1/CCC1 transporter family protein, partial [archaeon]
FMPRRTKSDSARYEHAEEISDEIFGTMNPTNPTQAQKPTQTGVATNSYVILVAGIATVLAEAISMAFSSYSSKRVMEEIVNRKKKVAAERDLKTSAIFWFVTMVGGMIPLIPFLSGASPVTCLRSSIISSMIFLFCVGFYIGKIVKVNPLREGLFNTAIGMAAATITYVVGLGISLIV